MDTYYRASNKHHHYNTQFCPSYAFSSFNIVREKCVFIYYNINKRGLA